MSRRLSPKDVVAMERVRLDKDTVTEEVQVDETLRRKQIEAAASDGAGQLGTANRRGLRFNSP